ncbi:MAG: SURF1 family protein [Litorilituus sp.]|jgi:surfeit locus 1 family protein|nr:SURF1 family protein [Litorilituus sp.]
MKSRVKATVKLSSILMSLLVGLLVIILINLGFWQLDRAKEKQHYLLLMAQRAKGPEKKLIELNLNDLDFWQVRVKGKLLHDYTFLLDNQVQNKKVGYQVVVPFLTHSSVLLVNLGWVADNENRQALPPLQQWLGVIELTGSMYQPKVNPFSLPAPNTPQWPKLVSQLTPEELKKSLLPYINEKKLFPAVLRLSEKSDIGYEKKWRWSNMPPEKHTAYAVQWFCLAAMLLLLFFAHWRKNSLKQRVDDNETKDRA